MLYAGPSPTAELAREREQEREAEIGEATYADLFGELISALVQCDPGRMVSTPGSGLGMAPAYDVFVDELAGINSDAMRSRVVYVLGLAATQKHDEALQQMALRLFRDVCHSHADGRTGL